MEEIKEIKHDIENEENRGTIDPIQKRMNDLLAFSLTGESLSKITSSNLRRKIAQASIKCEEEAVKVVADVQYVENINELKEAIIIKGEEEVEVPKLPITEMRLTNPKTGKIESVRYGLEALLTNHRLIFLDVTSTNHPEINSSITNKIEVSHIVTSNLTYYPVSLTEILGLSCDIGTGTKTTTTLNQILLWPISIVFAVLGIALGVAVNWYFLLLLMLGIPFLLIKSIGQGEVISAPAQMKQLKLAIIDPETKSLSKLILELNEEYPVPHVLQWIKEIQRRSPLLHEAIEITKNININLS